MLTFLEIQVNDVVSHINEDNENHRLTNSEMKRLRSRVNSYLGILSHYDTYRIREGMLESLDPRIRKRFQVRNALNSIKLI